LTEIAEYQSQQQGLAGAVAIIGLIIAGIIALAGAPIYGFAAAMGELAILASVFIYGQRSRPSSATTEIATYSENDEAPAGHEG
jgi:hypothetical protein